MMIGTSFRQGRRVLSSGNATLLRRSLGDNQACSLVAAPPFEPNALRAQQKRARSWLSSSASPGRTSAIAAPTTSWRSSLLRNAAGRSYRTSSCVLNPSSSEQSSDPATKAPPEVPRGALPPSLRAAIVDDLRSSDLDGNGRIDARDLRALLRRHGDSFSEAEVQELSELFYTSLGAGSVRIERFLEALDAAAAASKGGEGDVAGAGASLARQGGFKTHPLGIGTCASEYMYAKTHGKYSEDDLNIELTHVEPITFSDKTALFAVKCVRFAFDTATLWNVGSITKEKILNRAIFLETIAAIPGMVAAIIRHFRSLRNMARDGGMLNMFLEEANNERMHLLAFIRMKEPGYLFRAAVVGAQFGFGSFFLAAYAINPAWCHRFVGYIEEEACHTYTKILEEMEEAPAGSELAEWREADAPKIAKGYWHLGEFGTVLDVVKAVRADEAEHRDVNHAVSGVPDDTVNPLYDPRVKLDEMLKKYVKDIMEKEAGKQASVA